MISGALPSGSMPRSQHQCRASASNTSSIAIIAATAPATISPAPSMRRNRDGSAVAAMTARLEADPGAQQELAAGAALGVAALAAAGARRAMNARATAQRDAEQEGQQNRQSLHPVDLPLPENIPYHPPATNRGDRTMRKG